MVKLVCNKSPFFDDETKKEACPFHLIYKFDEDEEEYYLACYDEMHNHVLIDDPRIFPMPGKNFCKPRFSTPIFIKFERIDAPNWDSLSKQIIQLAKERCFDLRQVTPTDMESPRTKDHKLGPRNLKYGIYQKEVALLSDQEIMFECKFKVHGLCPAGCIDKAADAKTRQDQLNMTLLAIYWEEKQNSEDQKSKKPNGRDRYTVFKCPFRLIYRKKAGENVYQLIRHEKNHIH